MVMMVGNLSLCYPLVLSIYRHVRVETFTSSRGIKMLASTQVTTHFDPPVGKETMEPESEHLENQPSGV